MNQRQVFEAARACDDIEVMNVVGSAADNAADTLGSRFVRGNFSDEFVAIWFATVQGILSDSAEPAAVEWFASIGVTA